MGVAPDNVGLLRRASVDRVNALQVGAAEVLLVRLEIHHCFCMMMPLLLSRMMGSLCLSVGPILNIGSMNLFFDAVWLCFGAMLSDSLKIAIVDKWLHLARYLTFKYPVPQSLVLLFLNNLILLLHDLLLKSTAPLPD